jgi:hydrogenase maturation protein HypF
MTGDSLARKQISVRGAVQGVGFRPFVYRLAHTHGLAGWVLNHSGGVEIEVEGPPAALEALARDLTAKAPPLARIVGVTIVDAPPSGYTRFEIRQSVAEEGRYQLISPDIATCSDCLRELLDPVDRRFRYPFTNCTNCGPRFTIIRDIPYDRPLTTMAAFPMCPDCLREYHDPLDRRFHAQPNACPVCGPHVWLERSGAPKTRVAERDDALRLAGEMLRDGAVLALKGLGGFHLACDATNPRAVETLRARKGRPAKPLAVMMATLDEVRRHCELSPEEQALVTSPQCPIVLLRWRDDSTVAREVAPGNRYLGVMLPYTPLHHILLRDLERPLVMTSGNLSEEPIAQDNDEARGRLGTLADAFLLHDRDIYARYDDSVWFVPGREQPIRRSRGYAPFPVRLPFTTRPILAVGAELKNTFCVARDDFAFLSQHIGDMENVETLDHFEASVALFRHLFRVEPEVVAHDLHPDYLSTCYALRAAEQLGPAQPGTAPNPIPLVSIQHHHAHVAACLVDNGWTPDDGPVIGVAWDGTGYGLDGHIWGGEFFVGDYGGFQRVAHLEYLPMPGGEAAIHNPWRLALGYLYALTGRVPALQGITAQQARILCRQVDRGLNTPLTSAAGRLFDAVAALVGVRHQVTYEAQAAIEMEMLATRTAGSKPTFLEAGSFQEGVYPFGLEGDGQEAAPYLVRLRPLVEAIQADLAAGLDPAEIGYRFHHTMAALIEDLCSRIAAQSGLRTVTLTGGCFQNRLLLSLSVTRLEQAGFRVLLHRQVPCNDGGISLGQVALAHSALAGQDSASSRP